MATTLQPAMKKRQIIANSNRTMFVWVASMSAIVGICAVLSYFLGQHVITQWNVNSKLSGTLSTLEKNIINVEELRKEVKVLDTNAALNSAKANPEDRAVQVVLDALPADANILALGASLQRRLLTDVDGLETESINIEPAAMSDSGGSSGAEAQSGELPFVIRVNSKDANALKSMLDRLERSIRIISVDSLSIERSSNSYSMSVNARAFYLSEKKLELRQVPLDKPSAVSKPKYEAGAK